MRRENTILSRKQNVNMNGESKLEMTLLQKSLMIKYLGKLFSNIE